MKLGAFVSGGVLVLTLLIWNIYLINKNKALVQDHQDMEAKFNAREGDVDILRYDLVTARDSIRILLKNMDSVPVIQRKF